MKFSIAGLVGVLCQTVLPSDLRKPFHDASSFTRLRDGKGIRCGSIDRRTLVKPGLSPLPPPLLLFSRRCVLLKSKVLKVCIRVRRHLGELL